MEIVLGYARDLGLFPIAELETRIQERINLREEEIKSVSSKINSVMDKYFFRKIVDHHEIWTVWDGGELPVFEGEGGTYFCVWPSREYAELFQGKTIIDPKYVPIPIDDFVDEILFRNGKVLDSEDIGIFPVGDHQPFSVMSSEAFLEELVMEWRSRLAGNLPYDYSDSMESALKAIGKQIRTVSKFGPKGKIP